MVQYHAHWKAVAGARTAVGAARPKTRFDPWIPTRGHQDPSRCTGRWQRSQNCPSTLSRPAIPCWVQVPCEHIVAARVTGQHPSTAQGPSTGQSVDLSSKGRRDADGPGRRDGGVSDGDPQGGTTASPDAWLNSTEHARKVRHSQKHRWGQWCWDPGRPRTPEGV